MGYNVSLASFSFLASFSIFSCAFFFTLVFAYMVHTIIRHTKEIIRLWRENKSLSNQLKELDAGKH